MVTVGDGLLVEQVRSSMDGCQDFFSRSRDLATTMQVTATTRESLVNSGVGGSDMA